MSKSRRRPEIVSRAAPVGADDVLDRRISPSPSPRPIRSNSRRAGRTSSRCNRTSSMLCRSGPGAPRLDATCRNALLRFSLFATASIVIAGTASLVLFCDFGTAYGAGKSWPSSAPSSAPCGLSAVSLNISSCFACSLAVIAFPPRSSGKNHRASRESTVGWNCLVVLMVRLASPFEVGARPSSKARSATGTPAAQAFAKSPTFACRRWSNSGRVRPAPRHPGLRGLLPFESRVSPLFRFGTRALPAPARAAAAGWDGLVATRGPAP